MFDANTPEPEDPARRLLAELAGLGMELARKLQARALAAEAPEEMERLANAFHRVSRGVRQTLALDLRCVREDRAARRADREDVRRLDALREGAVRARKSNLDAYVDRLIWTEYEEPEAEGLQVRLNDWLDRASARDDFATADFNALVAEVCGLLGLTPDLPEPPFAAPPPALPPLHASG